MDARVGGAWQAVRAAEEVVEEVEKSCSAEHDALKQRRGGYIGGSCPCVRLEQTREEVSEMVATGLRWLFTAFYGRFWARNGSKCCFWAVLNPERAF